MPSSLYTPPRLTLPVSKGGDLIVDFLQTIDGSYVDYAPGVTVIMEVDIASTAFRIPNAPPPPPQTLGANASINGYHAVCRFESNIADTMAAGSLWRCIVSYPTVPNSTEIIGINGTITRSDGN